MIAPNKKELNPIKFNVHLFLVCSFLAMFVCKVQRKFCIVILVVFRKEQTNKVKSLSLSLILT